MKRLTTLSLGLASALFMTACHNSDSNSTAGTYKVTITNKTTGQPKAPMAAALHSEDFHVFYEGESASKGLEMQAEGGAPTALLTELKNSDKVSDSGTNGGLIKPGESGSVTLTTGGSNDCLSVTSMLVVTNDGFAGLDCAELTGLEKGDKRTFDLDTYDAGTEANTETAATVPGLNGEGFNAERDDSDAVTVHTGIEGSADIDKTHAWTDPSATVTVERIK